MFWAAHTLNLFSLSERAGKPLNPIRGRDRGSEFSPVNQEFPVGAKLTSITITVPALPCTHAHRYDRLNVLVRSLDCLPDGLLCLAGLFVCCLCLERTVTCRSVVANAAPNRSNIYVRESKYKTIQWIRLKTVAIFHIRGNQGILKRALWTFQQYFKTDT